MPLAFAITWDYRCPFARNVHEHILTALDGGADWDVRFVPFSLSQSHVEYGQPSVWERPEADSGLLALQVGVAIRDEHPELFPAVHRGLFEARHDRALHIADADVVVDVLERCGAPAKEVMEAVDGGAYLRQVADEHERAVSEHEVWGVPTFISGDHAAFVRLMDRSPAGSDAAGATSAIERVVSLLAEWPALNEFKHTSLRR